jgi:hypothetical protein
LTCNTTIKQLEKGGDYTVKQLGSIWEMQRHIRQYGSIVCSMQLYSDVKPFFTTNRSDVYRGPGGCPWPAWGGGCGECVCVGGGGGVLIAEEGLCADGSRWRVARRGSLSLAGHLPADMRCSFKCMCATSCTASPAD